MAGNYPCCCGSSGNVEATCPECSSYTLTISGISDSVTNPGTDIFGNPIPVCGLAALNGTFTGTITNALAEWGFYGFLYQACGARQTVSQTGNGVTNGGGCGCSTNYQGSGYEISFGFDILPNFNRTFFPSNTNPCYDPNNANWIADPNTNWIEVTLWYKEVVFPIFGNLPSVNYRAYRFAPSTCTPSQSSCNGFSWTFTQANEIESPTNGTCGHGAMDTSNVSITITLGP